MARSIVLAAAIVLLSAPLALASSYVPGHTRDGGLYVPPHFRDADRPPHPAEAWFDALQRDKASLGNERSALPGSAGSPPAPPASAERHR